MSIKDILSTCPNHWSYYDIDRFTVKRIFDTIDFMMEKPENEFIIDMLKRGGKVVISCTNHIKSLPLLRKQHTIICFFLGNYIYNRCSSIQECINRSILSIRRNQYQENEKKRFRYIWMLSCIFHDLGYSIENGHINDKDKEIKKALKELENSNYMLTPPYSKSLVKNYYKYRKERFECIDHGIAGGALLYRDLCELRKGKEAMNNDSNLYWGDELEKDFSFASWTIACHNIYKITPDDEAELYYKYFKLSKLITSKRIMSKESHPFLYLLCLVDSIEPLKQIGDISLLNNINIEISENELFINPKELDDMTRCKYLGKILSLKGWLTDVEIIDNRSAIIKL